MCPEPDTYLKRNGTDAWQVFRYHQTPDGNGSRFGRSARHHQTLGGNEVAFHFGFRYR
jgi:hypothetical protein